MTRRPSGLNGKTSFRHSTLTAALVCLLIVLGITSCSDDPGTRVQPVGASPSFFVDRDYLASHCRSTGVVYPIKTEERVIDGSNSTPDDDGKVERLRARLADRFGGYARRFFDEIGLREIVLCRKLAVDGISCLAFADVERGRLFVAIDSGATDPALVRSLHHEVFHFVDFAEDGRLDEDPAWSDLNSASFHYGNGGGSMQGDPDASRPDHSLVGFLDPYATSGLAEDKAETYALLRVDGPGVVQRAATDSILARKVKLIRASLGRFGALAPSLIDAGL